MDSEMDSAKSIVEWPWKDILSIEGAIAAAKEFWIIFGPGGKLHPAYLLEHHYHIIFEVLLVVVILIMFLRRSYKVHTHNEDPLTDKEMDMLCEEWQPEPLVPVMKEEDRLPEPVVVEGHDGMYASVKGRQVINFASGNFLNLGNTPEMMDVARATIDKYGVGSCGPRGFYGTIDVHLTLEKNLAKFMGTEDAIIYSYDIATVSSIIPSFANRKDIIVADENVSFPIQQGIFLSKAKVHYFKHNDVADLERILAKVVADELRDRKPLCRRFVVVEGIYANLGDIAPLDEIYAVKEKYKFRMLVEETNSFGVMGERGRGACEHFGLEPEQVEVICASMGNSLASIGGFCVGNHEMVEHQRLSSNGYCFSASLPPYLATSADLALKQLDANKALLLPKLHRNTAALRKELAKIPGLSVIGQQRDSLSPLIHVQLSHPPAKDTKYKASDKIIQRLADCLLQQHDLLTAVSRYSTLDRTRPPPSLKFFVSTGLSDSDVISVAAAVKAAVKEVM